MNIPWEKQPTPEHVWIAADSEKNSGWHIKEGDRYYAADNRYWRACDNNDLYKVHHRPEPEFKQGDLVDVIYDDEDLDTLWGVEFTAKAGGIAWIKTPQDRFVNLDTAKLVKHESVQDKFIRISMMATDPALTKVMAIQLWEAGFRYTGDKE